jgi:hypothetical protein
VQSDKASGLLKGTLLFLGRSLLGLYFLLPGAAKFLDWDRPLMELRYFIPLLSYSKRQDIDRQ